MSKLDQFIANYAKRTGLVIEAAPSGVEAQAALQSDKDKRDKEIIRRDVESPDAAMDVDPAAEPAAVAGEGDEQKKSLTDIGYVTAVKDMVKLLSISPSDIPESEYDIFDQEIKPENAFETHQKLRDMIDRHYVQ